LNPDEVLPHPFAHPTALYMIVCDECMIVCDECMMGV
jgi:hypothetical protein